MSTSVDNKVVSIQMLTANFKSKAEDTIRKLKEINKSGQLVEATKGVKNFDTQSKKVSLQHIANDVSNVTQKLSTMNIIGVTSLNNIAQKAISAGTQMIKSLTVDPITAGLDEYETKMNAITTILTNTASKGTTLDDVNASLEDLNVYADQTIYNFAEMTRAIGTFTAAGVGLEDSTTAIKGLSNLAAGSGSTAQQSATANYQLSQALGKGFLGLEDYNSVVNAGMGGEMFKQTMIDIGLATGAIEEGQVTLESFRESLKDEWVSNDVMMQAFEIFANDEALTKAATQVKTWTQLKSVMQESVQSGWAQSWEHIIGDKDEAAALFTSISEGFNSLIGPSTEARNNMLEFWNANGGREAIINGLSNVCKGLGKVMEVVGKAFRKVFPPKTGQDLVDASKGFENFTKTLIPSEEMLKLIGNTMEFVFGIVKFGTELIRILCIPFKTLAGGLISGVVDLFEKLGNTMGVFTTMSGSDNVLGSFLTMFESVVVGLDKGMVSIGDVISTILGGVLTGWDAIMGGFQGGLEKGGKGMKAFADGVKNVVDTVSSYIDIQAVADFIKTLMGIFVLKKIADFVKGLKKFNEGLTAFAEITKTIKDSLKEWGKSFNNVIKEVENSMSRLSKAKAFEMRAEGLLKIAAAVGVLALAVALIAILPIEKVTTGLAVIGVVMLSLVALGVAINALPANLEATLLKVSVAITLIAGSMLVLFAAIGFFTLLDPVRAMVGVVVLAGLLGAIFILVKGFSKISAGAIKAASLMVVMSVAFIALSISINAIAKATERLAAIPSEQLYSTLGYLVLLIGSLITATTLLTKMSAGGGIVGLSALSKGLLVLSASIFVLSMIPAEKAKQGVITLAGSLSILVAVTALMQAMGLKDEFIALSGSMVAMGFGLIQMGAAVMLFSAAAWLLGQSLPVLVNGIVMAIHTLLPAVIQGVTLLINAWSGFILAMAEVVPAIGVLITSIIQTICTVIRENVTTVGQTLVDWALGILQVLIDNIGEIIQKVLEFVVAFIDGLANGIRNNFPLIWEAGLNLIGALLEGMWQGILKIFEMIGPWIAEMGEWWDENKDEVFEQAKKLFQNFINGCGEVLGKIGEKLGEVITSIKNWVIEKATWVWEKGCELFTNFIDGIVEAITNIPENLAKIPGIIDEALDGIPGDCIQWGKDAIQGFIDGCVSLASNIMESVKNTVMAPFNWVKEKLGIASPSKLMRSWGAWSLEGFALGFEAQGKPTENKVKKTMNGVIGSVNNSLDGVNTIEVDVKPVLDIDEYDKSLAGISKASKVSIGGTIDASERASSSAAPERVNTPTPPEPTKVGDVIFNQYNTSPEALDRAAIYRETKRQLRRARGEGYV